MDAERLVVTVVLAAVAGPVVRALSVETGTSVADAVARSGALAADPGLDPARLGYAIYGRAVRPEQPVEDGDRVEVLRPLIHDPRDRRRALARQGRSIGRSARGR